MLDNLWCKIRKVYQIGKFGITSFISLLCLHTVKFQKPNWSSSLDLFIKKLNFLTYSNMYSLVHHCHLKKWTFIKSSFGMNPDFVCSVSRPCFFFLRLLPLIVSIWWSSIPIYCWAFTGLIIDEVVFVYVNVCLKIESEDLLRCKSCVCREHYFDQVEVYDAYFFRLLRGMFDIFLH